MSAASEMVPFKAGAEFLLSGTAHPPKAGVRAMEVEAALRFNDGSQWRKTLLIAGERQWKKNLLGAAPTDAKALGPLPLRYEHAFGGVDDKRDKVDKRNPVGRGFAHRGRVEPGQPLPQIERGPRFIVRPTEQPEPAGYGPIPSHWQPRLEEQKGFDLKALEDGHCPYPRNVSASLFNCAPKDQRFPQAFQGGEQLSLRGFFPDHPGAVELELPQPTPEAFLVIDNRWQPLTLQCDTLQVDTDAGELYLVWRVGIPWPVSDPREAWVLVQAPHSQAEHETEPHAEQEVTA
ncbi:DUF2169 domain-containing protein [Alkalilimnicola ehrlichii]|uniref:DUF2169 family type VI secretion system accessory protein n=1 Tax=Alkalilimnicola ehrlichii TaxID=351052 RepID=UPI0011C0413B|nr:DUF2169 domain-containing protein [Alkalilimnicola ehrlichii]